MTAMAEDTLLMSTREHALEAENAALRHLQAALEIAQAHYESLYALAPAAYCTICPQGAIVQANRAASALLAVTPHALIGQAVTQFIADADLDKFEQYRQQVIDSGQAQSCDLHMVDADRRQFRALLQSSVTHGADGALQVRILLCDITAARPHDEPNAPNAPNAPDTPDAAADGQPTRRADLAESQLRAKISHDLRQPLSALGIYATVLKNHVAPAGQPLLAQIQLCLASLSELLAEQR